ncbi:predicted protein [Naegleria gruberi]|uniref:Predicted protein n=1 Tax=Naegleria gruberi TaxID=5762 RepID=D2V1L4_NAEGR|nr:uncharacterized protein NAEGRDRAFT_62619 [Naegleria gruberi]EFC49182.1 predicted protein [Naegleria gruberi]|eukprot:XP_002681926.1 predicted protein [Naegleria gruberi strain NEG-M]
MKNIDSDCMVFVLEFMSVADHVYQLSRVCSDWRINSIKFIVRYLDKRYAMLGDLVKQFETCFGCSVSGRKMRKFLMRCHVRDLAEYLLDSYEGVHENQQFTILWVKSEMEILCNYLKISNRMKSDGNQTKSTGFFTKIGKLFSKKTHDKASIQSPNKEVESNMKQFDYINVESSIQGNLNDLERYYLVNAIMGIEFIPEYDEEGNLDESVFSRACLYGSTDIVLELKDWFKIHLNIRYPKLTSDNLEPKSLLSHSHLLMISGISMQTNRNNLELIKELDLNKKLFKDDSCKVSNYEQVVVGVKVSDPLLNSQQMIQTAFSFDGLQYFEFNVSNPHQMRVLYWYSILMSFILSFLNS